MDKLQYLNKLADESREANIFEKLWFKLFPLHFCTGCGKPITTKEAKQFSDRYETCWSENETHPLDCHCERCWYETCQERTLNEEIEQ